MNNIPLFSTKSGFYIWLQPKMPLNMVFWLVLELDKKLPLQLIFSSSDSGITIPKLWYRSTQNNIEIRSLGGLGSTIPITQYCAITRVVLNFLHFSIVRGITTFMPQCRDTPLWMMIYSSTGHCWLPTPTQSYR